MKRVAIIGDFCYPNFAGGSSKHVFDLITNFPRHGLDISLLTRKRDESSQYKADDIQAVAVYDDLKRSGKIKELNKLALFNPYYYFSLLRGCDYVLLQHPIMGMIGGIVARILGKRVIIYHYHGPLHLEYQAKIGGRNFRYKLLWLFQKITVKCASLILVHSEYMKNIAMQEHGISEEKINFLPPYIDLPDNISSLSWRNDESDKTTLLIPRRLTARTGVIEFLEGFLNLPESEQQHYHIYITGTGELAPRIKEIAREHADTITYWGFVTYDELRAIYGHVDAVVVPTISLEGLGYVILEAMVCGSSVIVSETCGGGYEFVTRELGGEYTFDVYDSDSIRRTLDFIRSHPNNRDFYKNISRRFSTDNMIRQYLVYLK